MKWWTFKSSIIFSDGNYINSTWRSSLLVQEWLQEYSWKRISIRIIYFVELPVFLKQPKLPIRKRSFYNIDDLNKTITCEIWANKSRKIPWNWSNNNTDDICDSIVSVRSKSLKKIFNQMMFVSNDFKGTVRHFLAEDLRRSEYLSITIYRHVVINLFLFLTEWSTSLFLWSLLLSSFVFNL